MYLALLLPAVLQCSAIGALPADDQPAALKRALEDLAAPTAIYVTGAGVARPFGAAAGLADPHTERALTPDTPMRIASNTKTFTAATVLRLWEQGRTDLDAPVAPMLDPALVALLRADGYAVDKITVRQLLSHSAGLYDHGADSRYVEAALARPERVLERADQVRMATVWGDPAGAPGERFLYSDTGYVLLGDLIERLTGEPLAAAVRRELRLGERGLGATWWEIAEPPPGGAEPRARQFLGEVDATDIHASFDLYGGGGLVMSPRDLAVFMADLFEGRVFDRPETLEVMLARGAHEGADQYRIGMLVKEAEGREIYHHSGFWGTAAYYDRETRRSVAVATTRQQTFRTEARPLGESVLGVATPPCG